MRKDMRIKCAAIKPFDDERVWASKDHFTIKEVMAVDGVDSVTIAHRSEEGFVAECGRFIMRKAAAHIALKAGQVTEIKKE